jgi:hypothetical protein
MSNPYPETLIAANPIDGRRRQITSALVRLFARFPGFSIAPPRADGAAEL